jgi:hypothetical protein
LFPPSILLFKHALHCVAWTLRKAAAGQTFALLARLFFSPLLSPSGPASSGFPLRFDFSSVYSRPYSQRKNHQSLFLPTAFEEMQEREGKTRTDLDGLHFFCLVSLSTSLLLLHFHHYSVIILFFSKKLSIPGWDKGSSGFFITRYTRAPFIISRL